MFPVQKNVAFVFEQVGNAASAAPLGAAYDASVSYEAQLAEIVKARTGGSLPAAPAVKAAPAPKVGACGGCGDCFKILEHCVAGRLVGNIEKHQEYWYIMSLQRRQ